MKHGKQQIDEYSRGYLDAQYDVRNNLPLQGSRLWTREYRNGYSDSLYSIKEY